MPFTSSKSHKGFSDGYFSNINNLIIMAKFIFVKKYITLC